MLSKFPWPEKPNHIECYVSGDENSLQSHLSPQAVEPQQPMLLQFLGRLWRLIRIRYKFH